MRLIVFLFSSLLFSSSSYAFILKGTVYGENNKGLAYTNIYVKGTSNGTSANSQGRYQLDLPAGDYEIVFQHLGYKQQIENVSVSANVELNVVLTLLEFQIRDVVINASEDQAIAVIQKAIEKRKYFLSVVESYSCDAYVKGLQRITEAPDRILGRRINRSGTLTGPNNSGVLYLSESQSRLYYMKPNKFREVVYSSKVSGAASGFTFNSAQNFYFNFYERSISIPFIAQRPFISPLSETAFFYYNYRMLGAYQEGDRLINKILVTPKRKNDPCFNGVLSIVEDNWNIHSLELYLTKRNGIQYIDTLKVTQYFIPIKNDIWLPSQQRYDANGGILGVKGDGYYLGIFKNYIVNDIIAMEPTVAKKDTLSPVKKSKKTLAKREKKVEKEIFSAEVLKVEQGANKRTEQYWDSIRPVPLTELEVGDYKLKDSIQVIRDSKEFKDSSDRRANVPGVLSILTGYTFRRQNQKISITVPSPLTWNNYNTVEGYNLHINLTIRKEFNSQRSLSFEPFFRYGFANRQFNSKLAIVYKNSQKNSEYFTLSGGRYISQFNDLQPQQELDNTEQSLLLGFNFMKIYQQYFLKFDYTRELFNGLDGNFSLLYARRQPLENMSHYTFFSKNKLKYSANGVDLPDLIGQEGNIPPNNIFRLDIQLHLTFGRKYITRPDSRFRIDNSKYPELYLTWRKAIPIKGFSDQNFDMLEIQMRGEIPMKLLGTTHYQLGGGGFPNTRSITYADYHHFYGNFITYGKTDLLGFYLIRYYRHSTSKYFTEAHIEHHFGGFFFNKIPGIRTLKLGEVVGFHFLYSPTRGAYYQLDAGIDNIFKIMRVDFVAGWGQTVHNIGGRVAFLLNVLN
ncbi:MAG: carboxypeptidase-like regulatory domain-containing protein [Bacteroidetes bacterium]|nr:carboxypeptidase-like regulatory domain-containing protein [Bacteroidota bacterium]